MLPRLNGFHTISIAQYNRPKVMPEKPEMSLATKELLKKVRMIVPPMLEKFHKGMICALRPGMK